MSPRPSRTFWHLALPDFQPQKPSREQHFVVLDSSLQPFQARLNGGNITVPKLPIQYFPSIYTYMGIDPHYEGLTCSHVPPRLQCCHSALVVVQRGTGTGRPDPAKGGRNHDPCRTQGSTSGIYPTCKLAIYQLTGMYIQVIIYLGHGKSLNEKTIWTRNLLDRSAIRQFGE